MTDTIYGTCTTKVTLSAAIDNPAYITAAGPLTDGLVGSYQGLIVVNAGSIAIAGHYIAINLTAGDSVTNQRGGVISRSSFGIFGTGGAVTVVNAGSIAGNGPYGIDLVAGGSVTNQSGGWISGTEIRKNGT